MKIIFSRKGFDSTQGVKGRPSLTGGVPSPIIDGMPISVPIHTGSYPSETKYGDLHHGDHCLGDIVEHVTNKTYTAEDGCHNDPMFENNRWAFGQADAAQSHLKNCGVDEGDVFLFFGLFAYKNKQNENYRRDWHHRIFGCLTIEKNGVKPLGRKPDKKRDQPKDFSMPHPHVLTKFSNGENHEWQPSNTLYIGKGYRAQTADDALRLTHPDDKSYTCSRWLVPQWLRDDVGLDVQPSCRAEWSECPKDPKKLILQIKGRGQEFVSGDISGHAEARKWLADKICIMKPRKGDSTS